MRAKLDFLFLEKRVRLLFVSSAEPAATHCICTETYCQWSSRSFWTACCSQYWAVLLDILYLRNAPKLVSNDNFWNIGEILNERPALFGKWRYKMSVHCSFESTPGKIWLLWSTPIASHTIKIYEGRVKQWSGAVYTLRCSVASKSLCELFRSFLSKYGQSESEWPPSYGLSRLWTLEGMLCLFKNGPVDSQLFCSRSS